MNKKAIRSSEEARVRISLNKGSQIKFFPGSTNESSQPRWGGGVSLYKICI